MKRVLGESWVLPGLDALLLVIPGLFRIGLAELQNGVGLKFLLDTLLQCHQRQLEDFHALDHAGGQQLPLIHPHRE